MKITTDATKKGKRDLYGFACHVPPREIEYASVVSANERCISREMRKRNLLSVTHARTLTLSNAVVVYCGISFKAEFDVLYFGSV